MNNPKITESKAAEVAISHLAAIVESSDDAIISKDLNGIITSWNKGAEKVFGYTASEMVGTSIRQIIPSERQEEENYILGKIRRGEKVEHWETLRQTKDGRLINISVTASPIKDTAGNIIGASKIARDITVQKKHEQEIIRLSRLYSALSQINQAIVWTRNRDELFGKVCRVLVELGKFRMAWIGEHHLETRHVRPVARWGDQNDALSQVIIYSDDRPEGHGPTGTAIREGIKDIRNDFIHEIRHPQWREWARRADFRAAAAFPIRHNGKVWGALTVYSEEAGFFQNQEISLLEEAAGDVAFALENLAREQALRESEERYKALFDRSLDCVFLNDFSGQFLDANQAALDLLGYQREDIATLTFASLLTEDQLPLAFQVTEEIKTSGHQKHPAEFRLRGKDGRLVNVETRSSLIYREGKPIAIQGIARDITERKQAEALLFASEQRLKGFFTSAPAGLALLDPELRYVQLNETVAKVNGVSIAEHLGKTVRQILPKLAPAAEPLLQKVLATGQPICNVELSGETPGKPGVLRHWLETFFPTFGKDGRPDGIGVIFVETTEQKQAEKELRESEEKLSRIFESSPMAMALSTLDEGRYLDVNPEFLKILQRTREEVIGHTALELGVWTNREQRNAQMAKLKERQSLRNVELAIRGKLGQLTQILWSVEPVCIGGQDCLLGSLLDITERKRVEVALSNSEEKYRKIFENVRDVFYQTDTEGRIIEISPSIERYSGYRRAELIGKPVDEVYHDREDRDRLLKILHEQGEVMDYELRLKTKNGHLVHASVNAHILLAAGGKPAGVEGALRDITERKRIEETNVRLATAVEQSAESIIITDTNGAIVYVNPAFEKISGHARAEVLGRNPSILKSGKHDGAFYRRMWEVLKFGEAWQGHIINLNKDGKPYEVEATISPVRDAKGVVANYVAVQRDVTREVQLEAQFRQSQKLEAFGQLAGGVAHDFSNILAVIQLQAGLLKSEPHLSLEQLEFADGIEKAAGRGANLTRQLLLFSRKQTMQPRNLKLEEVVENMAKMLQRTLGEQVQLQFKFATKPLVIHADPGMIDQILLNLVVNARDAMPKGGQIIIETAAAEFDEVTATQTVQARPGLFACLSVSDTGCGISPEILPRIFEPFFTTKEVGKGTGLGLATVYGIVQQHQGWINVYSEVGRGTTFRVYLPRQMKTTDTDFFRSSHAALRGGSETILLVEDEFAVRSSVRITLSRLGYRVLEATTGAEALAVWKQHRDEVQLLLTDLVMPGHMNGKELAGQLLQQNPQLKVIYASGYSAEIAGKDLVLEEGVNFLAKPFRANELARAIRDNLDKPA